MAFPERHMILSFPVAFGLPKLAAVLDEHAAQGWMLLSMASGHQQNLTSLRPEPMFILILRREPDAGAEAKKVAESLAQEMREQDPRDGTQVLESLPEAIGKLCRRGEA